MNVAFALLGLGFLIFAHELGHFLTALAVGMRPRRFYVGFPPALVKTRRKGIEYGLGAIPLGGFVKLPGMHRPAPSDVEAHLGLARHESPALVRPIEQLKRALAETDFDAAGASIPDLEDAIGRSTLSGAAVRAADRGVRELRDGLAPEAYWRQPAWKRIAVIFAGPGTNLVLAVALFAALFMAGGGKATTTVDSVLAGAPADRAGLRSGDRIVAIDGVRVQPADIPERISASEGSPITVVVQRHGRPVTLGPVTPRRDGDSYRLGFVLRGKGMGPVGALGHSFRVTWLVTEEIGRSLGRLVHGSGRKDVSSPVGIVQGSSNALDEGFQTFVWVLGLISLSLALLNLLPLLPLDGGHIAFSLVEAIRGRAVGREVYERVSAIGIAFVILLFVIGLSNDIGRLGGE